MPEDKELREKIKDFLLLVNDIDGNAPFITLDELVNQAVVLYTLDQLDTKINTLESIKHILNKDQNKDIDNIIEMCVGMKAKLYEEFQH